MTNKQDALNYHSEGRRGKLEVVPTKPHSTQRDLSLAYSPGVAVPCLEIQKDPDTASLYTMKGNLVAVISNGTAVLGLGDIGALAGKPVMEGKGLLFKIFADIDVFDIEVDQKDVDKFVETVIAISPTFGGINLEDIKAPECFEIEERLKAALKIPVMHDDQHGTAIISCAALINSLELSNKKIGDVVVVVNGAGAAAMSCTKLFISLGVKPENVIMCDSKGVMRKDNPNLGKYKLQFATERNLHTLEEAMKGADVFFGLSVANSVTPDMVRSMAANPIIFAMANPDPEIPYNDAVNARPDIIMATGRSDNPNQVNNVLGFPYIFRGALDVKATCINEEMKIAAVYAIAALAKEDVPESVNRAYKVKNLSFGKEYIIPKPLDPRLLTTVAPAVAMAAIKSGVARNIITDWNAYKEELLLRLGHDNKLLRNIHEKAKNHSKRVVFAEANNFNVLKAAQVVMNDGIAEPILLGNVCAIKQLIEENDLGLEGVLIIDPRSNEESQRRENYAKHLWEKRRRKGMLLDEAIEKMYTRNYFGAMMVEMGEADAMISGVAGKYSDTIRPAIEVVGTNDESQHIAGMYIMMTKKGPIFFADTTVNIQPSAHTLVETTLLSAKAVRTFGIEPVIAMLSYSNFGSRREGSPLKVAEAISILHKEHPELIVDGEIQANFALNREMRMRKFPFSKLLDKKVNTLIFPNLSSGNIAYKIMQEIGEIEAIGPILLGMKKPIHVVPVDCSVREIVNMTAIAVVDAQSISNE
jgi:malate dehydrogenase (oxaloacetate-decarboxylating)(NADP+)